MSGSLNHSPADIMRHTLVELGLGTLPTSREDWPISYSQEPDSPDDAITLYDTTSRIDGRSHLSGETWLHYGIQVRIRSYAVSPGRTKANAITEALDKDIQYRPITIAGTTYIVYTVTRTTDSVSLGKEVRDTKRNLFTINAVVALRQTS